MVAAIGEQILGPTDVSLSNWTVRPSSGCSVVLATHTAGAASVDGYTLTLAVNLWNIVRTYNLTPGPELLFACRYRLGTASNFVVYMSEADNVYDLMRTTQVNPAEEPFAMLSGNVIEYRKLFSKICEWYFSYDIYSEKKWIGFYWHGNT